MTDYVLDTALRDLKERLRKLELSVARNKPASGVTVGDSGGFFGSPGTLTMEEILALIGAGLSPGAFLTVIGGGKGTVNPMGTLGATQVVDLGLGNYHWGTLDQNATITTTGWTNGKDCQITVEVIEDGTGGWVPTFTGITWIGSTPTPSTAAGTVSHYVLFSRDGGTTIYGALVGGGASSDGGGQTPYLIESGETFTVPVKKQALKAMPITVDAGGSLVVDGFLLEVA